MSEVMLGFVLSALSLLMLAARSQAGMKQSYCQWEKFNASCPDGKVIMMESAEYGRMKFGRCIPVDFLIGCSANVLDQADQRCSGKKTCTIEMPDSEMFTSQPCRKDLVAYFEASYDCVPVINPLLNQKLYCSRAIDVNNVTVAYLASSVTAATSLGSRQCPWQINASPGQHINVTLLDFNTYDVPLSDVELTGSLTDTRPSLPKSKARQPCMTYAQYQEGDSLLAPGQGSAWQDVTFCQSLLKRRWLFTTKSHTLRIRLNVTKQMANRVNFMLNISVIGCADIKPLEHATINRDGDSLMISCNHTSEKWHLVCSGNRWVGNYHNCSASNGPGARVVDQEQGFPIGLLIAIAIGVIVGVVLGFVFLIFIFVCRRRSRHESKLDSGNPLMGPGQVDPDQQNIYRLVEVRPPPLVCDCQYTPGADHKSIASLDNTLLMPGPGECLYRTNPTRGLEPAPPVGECHYQSREAVDHYHGQPANMSPLKTCDIISDIHHPVPADGGSLQCCEGPDWYNTAHQQYLRSSQSGPGDKLPRIAPFPAFASGRPERGTLSRPGVPSSRDSGNVTDNSDASTTANSSANNPANMAPNHSVSTFQSQGST